MNLKSNLSISRVAKHVLLLAYIISYKTSFAQPTYWRATIDIQGHELPFGMEFSKEQNKEVLYIYNAEEKIKVDELKRSGDSLFIHLPIFDSEIRVKGNKKTLTGIWHNYSKGKKHAFFAQEISNLKFSRFNQIEQVTKDFSGKWEVDFSKGAADSSKALGIFKQQGSHIMGTFLTTTGDYRYLEGNVNKDTLLLSCFDGSHAFLFKAFAQGDGSLKGTFWSGATWNEPWTAIRNEKYELPDADKLTYLKPGYEHISFSFNDLNGKQVNLSDEKFKGKVVLLQIMGSWCPNCMDETAFLSSFYKKHSVEGLEIIGLAYERTKDVEKACANVKRLKGRFDVNYTLLLAGTSDKIEAAKTLPMLNQVLGFPTTIFIDKKGNVRRIYTGYNGPATGVYHEKFVRDFEKFVERLLNEQ